MLDSGQLGECLRRGARFADVTTGRRGRRGESMVGEKGLLLVVKPRMGVVGGRAKGFQVVVGWEVRGKG